MNNRHKCIIGWIAVITTILVITILFVYWKNGFCIAWNVDINHEVTSSFANLLGAILTPAIGIITAIIYYSTLQEQRKQNFEDKWQNILETQLKIRDSQEIDFKVLDNNWNDKIKHLRGYQCMLMAWMLYKDLIAVLRLKENCLNREKLQELEDNYYNALELDDSYQTEIEYLRQYEPLEYTKILNESKRKRRMIMTGNIFGISGDEKDDPNELAFRLVFDTYFSRASTYFSHIISMLRFLDRNLESYGKDKIRECIQYLKDNLNSCEWELIMQYAEYDTNNKALVTKYITK